MRHVPAAELKDNAAELVAALDAGEDVVVTLGGRGYRLVATEATLSAERRRAMEELAAFRQALRESGVRVTRDEIKAWINEGRP